MADKKKTSKDDETYSKLDSNKNDQPNDRSVVAANYESNIPRINTDNL